jgi:hypothetical protein
VLGNVLTERKPCVVCKSQLVLPQHAPPPLGIADDWQKFDCSLSLCSPDGRRSMLRRPAYKRNCSWSVSTCRYGRRHPFPPNYPRQRIKEILATTGSITACSTRARVVGQAVHRRLSRKVSRDAVMRARGIGRERWMSDNAIREIPKFGQSSTGSAKFSRPLIRPGRGAPPFHRRNQLLRERENSGPVVTMVVGAQTRNVCVLKDLCSAAVTCCGGDGRVVDLIVAERNRWAWPVDLTHRLWPLAARRAGLQRPRHFPPGAGELGGLINK